MRVLIVDDSRTMRMIVKRTLRHAGFEELEIAEAGDGREALSMVASFAPQAILSDWNMPELSGLDFLLELRAGGDDTTFGFVTSEASVEMVQRATAAGAQFFITKPFTVDTFRQVLIQFLSE